MSDQPEEVPTAVSFITTIGLYADFQSEPNEVSEEPAVTEFTVRRFGRLCIMPRKGYRRNSTSSGYGTND